MIEEKVSISKFKALCLCAVIHNYSDLFVLIFSHHRGTEGAETLFLFAHRETRPPCLSESDGGQAAMGKKSAP